MDEYWHEFDTGEIHLRDRWQFELKSDYYPPQSLKRNTHIQEFYIFIPNALHLNKETYSKQEFYHDRTSLIRLKTPVFTFSELINLTASYSPFYSLQKYLEKKLKVEDLPKVELEFKLLANIIRSALRDQVNRFIQNLDTLVKSEEIIYFNQNIKKFCEEFKTVKQTFDDLINSISRKTTDQTFHDHLRYINDFIGFAINDYITALIGDIRNHSNPELEVADHSLCELVLHEKPFRELQQIEHSNSEEKKEELLYRRGILNKFVLDVLLLKVNRTPLDEKIGHWVGAISAGVAMLVYVLFFVWQGQGFLLNSLPYIILTIMVYILKDRIKETFKAISFRQAFKWFSDYKTKIRSPNLEAMIGEVKESFLFVSLDKLPEDITTTRNTDFHDWLRKIRRPERVIYYKRKVFLNQEKSWKERLDILTIIFRLDIHRFLAKASNPFQPYSTVGLANKRIIRKKLPKVYHINIILKSTYQLEDNSYQSEIKKYRLIVDKNGIKRIEKITGHTVSQQQKVPKPDEES